MHVLKHIIGQAVPGIVIIAVFYFLGDFSFTGISLLKTTGASALYIFALIFMIGPLPRFIPKLSPYKVFRPFWAKWAVLLAYTHMLIAYAVVFDSRLRFMLSRENTLLLPVLIGLSALSYFVFMVVISEDGIRAKLGPWWKKFHTAGYIAFTLAVLHFVLMESTSGHFMPGRLIEKVLFTFAVMVIAQRIYVAIWVRFSQKSTANPAVAPSSSEVSDNTTPTV